MAPSKRSRPEFSPPRPGKSKSKPPVTKRSNASASVSKHPKPLITSKTKRLGRQPSTPGAGDSDNRSLPSESDEDNDTQPRDLDRSRNSSPEPDFMLAEVNYENSNSDPIIPLPLIHRIIQECWQDKQNAKISTDAREVLGKYVDILVREAIMRSFFERQERESAGIKSNDAWLEVEDLERIAPQLCLDF